MNELLMFRTPSVFQNGVIEEIPTLQAFHDLNLKSSEPLFRGNAEGWYEKSVASGTG